VFSKKFDPKRDSKHLKWVHILISNAKAFIEGTYHGLDAIHLQSFFDEFCFRFNRRFWPQQLFARTLFACSCASPFTRYALIG